MGVFIKKRHIKEQIFIKHQTKLSNLRYTVARAGTGELEVGTSLLGAGISLVAAVPAVVLPVALPGHRDAPAVVAPELGILAGHINAPSLV